MEILSSKFHTAKSDMSNEIEFGCWLTGHDEETVRQMYYDWRGKSDEPSQIKGFIEKCQEKLREYENKRELSKNNLIEYCTYCGGITVLELVISDLQKLQEGKK